MINDLDNDSESVEVFAGVEADDAADFYQAPFRGLDRDFGHRFGCAVGSIGSVSRHIEQYSICPKASSNHLTCVP